MYEFVTIYREIKQWVDSSGDSSNVCNLSLLNCQLTLNMLLLTEGQRTAVINLFDFCIFLEIDDADNDSACYSQIFNIYRDRNGAILNNF